MGIPMDSIGILMDSVGIPMGPIGIPNYGFYRNSFYALISPEQISQGFTYRRYKERREAKAQGGNDDRPS
jgi:hypothetical protein